MFHIMYLCLLNCIANLHLFILLVLELEEDGRCKKLGLKVELKIDH